MKVGKSVTKAISEFLDDDPESAMLHACNAIDGTARKRYPKLGNKDRFTRLLRDGFHILGPMGAPGININETRFPVDVRGPTATGGQPDIADVIYGIHRCTHGHGDDLPDGFDLLPDAKGPGQSTRTLVTKGRVQLSDRIIFGMLAVAVLAPENRGQEAPKGYHLTFNGSVKMEINDYWGREIDWPAIASTVNLPLVKLDFGEWQTAKAADKT